MMKEQCLLSLLAFASLTALSVGTEAQSSKAFEVASVRPHPPEVRQASWGVAGNRVDLVGIPPRVMITRAWGLSQADAGRLVGLPDWAMREGFDIQAVMPAGATAQDALEMLKTLLADRFGLRTHIEQRPYSVYALVVDPSGPKFSEVEAADDLRKEITGDGKTISDTIGASSGDELRMLTRAEPGGVRHITVTGKTRYSYKLVEMDARQVDAERITMEEFSRLVWHSMDRPVVDMTGLKGIYQFKTLLPPIRMSPRMQALLADRLSPDPPVGPSLSRALEALGLKLEPKNSPVDFIVVDRIDRPTPN